MKCTIKIYFEGVCLQLNQSTCSISFGREGGLHKDPKNQWKNPLALHWTRVFQPCAVAAQMCTQETSCTKMCRCFIYCTDVQSNEYKNISTYKINCKSNNFWIKFSANFQNNFTTMQDIANLFVVNWSTIVKVFKTFLLVFSKN